MLSPGESSCGSVGCVGARRFRQRRPGAVCAGYPVVGLVVVRTAYRIPGDGEHAVRQCQVHSARSGRRRKHVAVGKPDARQVAGSHIPQDCRDTAAQGVARQTQCGQLRDIAQRGRDAAGERVAAQVQGRHAVQPPQTGGYDAVKAVGGQGEGGHPLGCATHSDASPLRDSRVFAPVQ